MNTVTAHIGKEHYHTLITGDSQNQIPADEPLGVGGKNTGFSPGELLCASLASCITITLRMYADRKEWPLEAVDVRVSVVHDQHENTTSMESRINLIGNLTGEQRMRLMEIADKCSIHKILANPIQLSTIAAVHSAS